MFERTVKYTYLTRFPCALLIHTPQNQSTFAHTTSLTDLSYTVPKLSSPPAPAQQNVLSTNYWQRTPAQRHTTFQ